MLQSIHAFLFLELHLHYILQEYSTVLDSAYYSTIRITILILHCSCEQIYFQAFLFQNCIADCIQFPHEVHRVETTFYLKNYSSSTNCSQTTFSLHAPRLPAVYNPSSLQTQPTRNFLLGESAHSTRRNQDKNSTSRSLNATGI